MREVSRLNNVLLFVGGTDPSGGAGLPADLKTASAFGFHGCPVVSALTVQNSGNVLSWEPVTPELLLNQLMAAVDDGPLGAVKSGMLGSIENIKTLAGFLKENLRGIPFVLDPVLAAGGGKTLISGGMVELLREELLPLAALCTPNIGEAEALTGMDVKSTDDMMKAGQVLINSGAGAVLVKGGHLAGDPVDILVTVDGHAAFPGSRITKENVHGTGCTVAAAAASLLAAGYPIEQAVKESIRYVRRVITRKIERIYGNLPGHFPAACNSPEWLDSNSFYLPPAYCSMCGENLAKSPGQNGHLFCGKCGFIHYRNPLPAVALLVHDAERILLVRRAVPPGKGLLSLPGGFLETGETLFECGSRELFEETALRIRVNDSRLFELETDQTAYGGILLVVLEIQEWEGSPIAGDDASEVLWCPILEVPELAFRAHNRLVKKLADSI